MLPQTAARSAKKEPQGAPAAPNMSPRTSQELQAEPVETQVSRSSDKPPRTKEGSAAGAQPEDIFLVFLKICMENVIGFSR